MCESLHVAVKMTVYKLQFFFTFIINYCCSCCWDYQSSSREAQDSVVPNRIGMKFCGIALQVNVHLYID